MRSRCSIPSQCLGNPYPTRQNENLNPGLVASIMNVNSHPNRDPNLVNTDAFKVFDSFSVFGKPISNQTKLSDNFPFGFSVNRSSWWAPGVIHNTTVSKIKKKKKEIQITFISDEGSGGEIKDAVELLSKSYSSLLWFQIFILHRLCCLWNRLSILDIHKGIFCLKSQ